MAGGTRRNLRQLAWFVALWIAGVAVLGAIAYAIRLALGL